MRINARLDALSSQKLDYILHERNTTITEVIKDAIALYYQTVRREVPTTKTILERNGFIGCAAGEPDLSKDYKKQLGVSLERKYDHR